MSSLNQGLHEIILPITIDEWFRSYRLDELKKYLDITEKYLQKAKSDFEAHLDEQSKKLSIANLSPKELDEINDFYSDEYWRYSERFPRILRNSFLVSAIALLEYEMNVVCTSLKKKQDIRINLSDLRGGTLERTRKYFENAGFNLPFNNPTWQEIKYYSKVRNCIVHTNGLINELQYKDRKELIPYLTRKGIISQDTIKQEIALTEQFCKEVVETIQAFFVELEKNINLKSN
jgi:hypothetical protein